MTMNLGYPQLTIIALGGSIMVPGEIDHNFLINFKTFIELYTNKGFHFVIVAGGGKVARNYQEAAEKVIDVGDEDKDWLGIHATRLNAHLLRTIFRDIADPFVIDSRGKIIKIEFPVTIASGWQPGWSTDYIATCLAVDFDTNKIIIAGKPDHVYDKDNQKYPDAKPLPKLTWSQYRQLIPDKWTPGFSSPVDPIAAKLAEEHHVQATIINGHDLINFAKVLDEKEFVGTVIF